MSASSHIPQVIVAKNAVDLQAKIRDFQLKNSAKIEIISIYYDGRNHVAWVYLPFNSGGGLF